MQEQFKGYFLLGSMIISRGGHVTFNDDCVCSWIYGFFFESTNLDAKDVTNLFAPGTLGKVTVYDSDASRLKPAPMTLFANKALFHIKMFEPLLWWGWKRSVALCAHQPTCLDFRHMSSAPRQFGLADIFGWVCLRAIFSLLQDGTM